MNIPKIDLNIEYIKRCQKFQQEKAKTNRLIRRYMRLIKNSTPFSVKKNIDSIPPKY